jgi:hypothetical protein
MPANGRAQTTSSRSVRTKTYSLRPPRSGRDRWSLRTDMAASSSISDAGRLRLAQYARSPSDQKTSRCSIARPGRNIGLHIAESSRDAGQFYRKTPTGVRRRAHRFDLRFDPRRAWIAGRGTLPAAHQMTRRPPTLMLSWPSRCRFTSVSSRHLVLAHAAHRRSEQFPVRACHRTERGGNCLTLTVQYGAVSNARGSRAAKGHWRGK